MYVSIPAESDDEALEVEILHQFRVPIRARSVSILKAKGKFLRLDNPAFLIYEDITLRVKFAGNALDSIGIFQAETLDEAFC